MNSMSASARIGSTGSTPAPARSAKPGLVIEHLDALPDTSYVLFTVCSATRVTASATPPVERLEA
ncbi:hypothetical protein ACIRNI_26575 [Streptomyces sp. NPDC093546]|uniref:hypothetical protein n=1 Tax=Streptomyces sp. NPDC093546 TaxID=3366040 RepID=UPI0037FA27DD